MFEDNLAELNKLETDDNDPYMEKVMDGF